MDSNVAAFPLCRQHTLVSSIADELRSRQGEAATLFWRETARDLLRRLARIGVVDRQAGDEVRNLLYAVLAEIEADAVAARG